MKNIDYIKEPKAHPRYGEVVYDSNGELVCHICGKPFVKLGAHTWNKHGILAKDYRQMFGLDVTKGLCTTEHRAVLRQHVQNNYKKVVEVNLVKQGRKTRFSQGSEGRKKEKVSELTRRKLVELGKRTGPEMIKNTPNHKKKRLNK